MFALAWRNIWRHKTRSLITVSVVALAVFLSLLLYGFSGGMKNGIFELVTKNAGHLVIRVKDWQDIRDFDRLLIRDVEAKMSEIQAAFPEAEVSAVLEVPALLAGEKRSRGIQIQGIQAPLAVTTRVAESFLAEGKLPDEASLDEMALGQALAQALRVTLGDTVYGLAPGTEGVGAAAYQVVGLLDYPENELEGRWAYVSLSAAQELAAPGAVTRLELRFPTLKRLSDEARLEIPQARLASELGASLTVETWREANPGMSAYINIIDPYINLFAGLFFILSGLLVVNTIYLSLLERIREFGVIIAMGANRWQVMTMVFLESLTLVASGSVVGGTIGLGLVALLSRGFSFPFGLAEIYVALGLPRVMYASISAEQILFTFGFAFGVALLAALWPAWTAGRLQPVEAMRHAT